MKQIPSDFVVEDHRRILPAKKGPSIIYRVEEQAVTTLQVRADLAAAPDRSQSSVRFPALKNRQSATVQRASVRGNPPPSARGRSGAGSGSPAGGGRWLGDREKLPLCQVLPGGMMEELMSVSIAMPHHRAVYSQPTLAAAAESVLKAENLAIDDLRARILTRAYLSRRRRALLVRPGGLEVGQPLVDERNPGRLKVEVKFTLPRGSCAALVISAACADHAVGEGSSYGT